MSQKVKGHVRAVTERGPQGWLFLFFHVVMIGLSVTSEHRLMPNWGGFTWDEFLKVENFICSPPGRECSGYCFVFEAFMGPD